MDATGIARSGLDASMLRLSASASNIANAQVTGPAPANPADRLSQHAYRPVRAEVTPTADGGVSAQLAHADPGYRLTYDPASVHANAQGMIATPDVNIADELVEQLSAKLVFEANLKVFGTAAAMERRTFEMWR